MCNCSSSFFICLPVVDVRVVKPENCRWMLRRRSCSGRTHISIHTPSSNNFAFLGYLSSKSSKKIVFSLSCSSLPNEEDVVHQTVEYELPRESDLIRLVGGDNDTISSKGFKQTTTRSNLVAKQVISIQSALSLGYISQLWVDTTSVRFCSIFYLFNTIHHLLSFIQVCIFCDQWLVLVIDIKPSLLSGESERFLLKDIVRVLLRLVVETAFLSTCVYISQFIFKIFVGG